jgi:flagellar protein FliL
LAAKTDVENGETTEKSTKKDKKRKPLLLIILILVLVLIIGGVVAIFFLRSSLPFFGGGEAAEEIEAEERPRLIYSMREFQVNLADQGTRRFLRTTMDFAYNEKALTKEIEARESELRSHIISILRSKFVIDLDEPGGMKNLEIELIERLNSILENGTIEAIYYKEFIFQ